MSMAYGMRRSQAFANKQIIKAVALNPYDKTIKGFLPAISECFPQIRDDIEERRVMIALKPPNMDMEAPKLRTNGCQIGKSIP